MNFAITFDDGPDPAWTPAVLDALAFAGARATFFALGSAAERHPAAILRALEDGHAVELHGYDHLRHSSCDPGDVAEDAEHGLEVLRELGARPSMWRVPWGDVAPFTPAIAARAGLRLVNWTADTHDWRGDDAPSMLAAIAPLLEADAIVLAHDGVGPGALRGDCAETVKLIGPLVAAARLRSLEPGMPTA